MTVHNQQSLSDSTNTLPLPNLPFTLPHARLANLPQHQQSARNHTQYQDTNASFSSNNNNNAARGDSGAAINSNSHSYSSPAAMNEHSTDSSNSGHRDLTVMDALAYLDQVKNRFSDKLNVYNQFLDIMKDFKSQSIDTPGVIDRVSNLFKGHPNLIFGFNTFLPAGYRIEYSNDPRDPYGIKVITPNDQDQPQPLPQPQNDTYHASHTFTPPPLANTKKHATALPPPPYPSAFHTTPHQPQIHQTPTPPLLQNSERRPLLEFNHAVNFVNRVKTRYTNAPDMYRQFLDLLQLYQRHEMEISDVYANFCRVFHGAGDLIEEFKLFLPELDSRKRKAHPSPPELSYSDRKRALFESPKSSKRRMTNLTKKTRYEEEEEDDDRIISSKDIEFFDQVKRHIGNRPSYEEFLKILNLFSQQILDSNTLVEQAAPFLSDNKELFDTFKYILGYETMTGAPARPVTKPDLNKCAVIDESPSYREVSKDWQILPCSGRDELCWEVLNDTYMSHPMWGSEDNNFSAVKRNIYEDTLHRCEEERYEYDLNIEANLTVIALLKPIAQKIQDMSPEEQKDFSLKPGLGGDTVATYTRMVKQVYGDERGAQIIEMLYQNPSSVVPVLLKRLQLKDAEWKQAQKEYNKIWKEDEDKSFYRSLDYQYSALKDHDRKHLTPKALQTEADQQQKEEFDFIFDQLEEQIAKDISYLVGVYIEKQSSGYSKADQIKVQDFIDSITRVLQKNTDGQVDKEVAAAQVADAVPLDTTMEEAEEPVKFTTLITTINMTNSMNTANIVSPSEHYPLLKLYQIIYERLLKIKTISNQTNENKQKSNQIAAELGLIDNPFEEIDLSNGQYAAMMDVMVQFLEGKLEQQKFEDSARHVFGINAYVMFTIDKTIQTLIRQIKAYV